MTMEHYFRRVSIMALGILLVDIAWYAVWPPIHADEMWKIQALKAVIIFFLSAFKPIWEK